MMKRVYFKWKHNNKLDYVVIDDHEKPIEFSKRVLTASSEVGKLN